MNNKNKIALLATALAALLLSGCAATTIKFPAYLNSRDFVSNDVKRLGIIYGDFSVAKVTTLGQEKNEKAVPAFADTIFAKLKKQFEFLGVEVIKLDPAPTEPTQNPALARDLQSMREEFGRTTTEILKNYQKQPFLQARFAPEIGQFAELAKTPYILFFSASGWNRSGGNVAKSVALGVLTGVTPAYQYGCTIALGIVNAQSSEMAWYTIQNKELNPENANHLDKLVTEALKYFNPLVAIQTVPKNIDINVFTNGVGTISGRLVQIKKTGIVVKPHRGQLKEIPIEKIRSIQNDINKEFYYQGISQ